MTLEVAFEVADDDWHAAEFWLQGQRDHYAVTSANLREVADLKHIRNSLLWKLRRARAAAR